MIACESFQGTLYAKDVIIDDSKLLQIVPLGEYLMHIIFSNRIGSIDMFLVDAKLIMEMKPKRLN